MNTKGNAMMDMKSDAALRALAAKAAKTPDALADRVLQLQTADKFRLAGLLLNAGRPELAVAVGTRACQELELAMLFPGKA
jgi:hypothetical protein